MATQTIPQMIAVQSPNGRMECSGTYVVLESLSPEGRPMWKHSINSNVLYPMQNGRWGITSEVDANGGKSNLAYIHCPAPHNGEMPHRMKCAWRYWSGSKWIADKAITVTCAQGEAPKLSMLEALEMEDVLIEEYSKDEFQRKLQEAWDAAGNDAVTRLQARTLICLPTQISVLSKYGFEPSLKGVRQSVRATRPFGHLADFQHRAHIFNWLLDPQLQRTTPPPPPASPVKITASSRGRSGTSITLKAMLVSGEELATVNVFSSDTISKLREAIEEAASSSSKRGGSIEDDECAEGKALEAGPFKLVFRGEVLADTQRVGFAGLETGLEVLVVFQNRFKVLSASADGTARLFDALTGNCEQVFRGHDVAVNCAAASSDGTLVVTASADFSARLFDVASAECRHVLLGHRGGVSAVAFSPDDSQVLTAAHDGCVRLYDVWTGQCKRSLPMGGASVNDASFSPCGLQLLVASSDSTAKLFELSGGMPRQVFNMHRDSVNAASFSGDGVWVATASDDCTARIYRAATGGCEQLLLGHSRPVNSVVFSADGEQVLSASDDGTVRLFHAKSGGCVQLFRVQNQRIGAALFLPNGRHVLTGSADHLVRLFRVSTGESECTFKGHTDAIEGLCMASACVVPKRT